ncbi:MAG: DUF6569 family protein [Acidobacteriota bacterium]
MSVRRSALLALCLAGTVTANELSSDYRDGSRPEPPVPCCTPVPPPRPPRPDPRWGGQELSALLDGVRVGSPESYGGLTVYPVIRERGFGDPLNPRTLDQALSRGCLEIAESWGGDVNRLRARNDCGDYVFLMSGEDVYGGRQDRFVAEDGLLSPRSSEVTLPVFCSERGRWDDRPMPFRSGAALASPEIRKRLAESPAQDQVWRDVESETSRGKASSATGRYGQLFESPERRTHVERCLDRIGTPILAHRRTIGAVFVRGNEIVSAEIFAGEALFRAEFPKVLASQALVIWDPCDRCPYRPISVEPFLDSFRGLGASNWLSTYGAGSRYEVRSSWGVAQVLAFDGEVVHATLSASGWPIAR